MSMLEVVSVFTKAFNKHLSWVTVAIDKCLVAERTVKYFRAQIELKKPTWRGEFRQEKEN